MWALDIQNIFARVTGGSISHIDGLLKANGTANLFLLNPNGIIFGPNAQLNIGGSFLASTASSLRFADGTEFNATAPKTTPLLTVSVPVGLQFGGNQPTIQVQGSSLEVQGSKTLALVGGNVSIDGGILLAPGGRVELGGLAESGTIAINIDGSNLSLNFPDAPNGTLRDRIARSNIFLDNNAEVNVRAGGGGNIVVHALNLNLARGSKLRAGIASGLGSVDTQAGDIEIDATDGISFDGLDRNGDSSGVENLVESSSIGQGGNVDITAGTLSLTNGAIIKASTRGYGNAGNVSVRVRDMTFLDGAGKDPASVNSRGVYGRVISSGVYSRVEDIKAVGNGGNIYIATDSLSVTDGAVITASTEGRGNAGNITIHVRNTTILDELGPLQEIALSSGPLQFQQSSGIYSSVKQTGVGIGGNINITTGSLSLTNGALVITRTEGQGQAGNIVVNALDSVIVDGVGSDLSSSALLAPTEPGASGRGGDITVNTGVFRVLNGAVINAQTLNNNDAGNITINANIFEATGGGQAISTTSSSGRAGNITVNVTDKIILFGSDPNFAKRAFLFNTNIVGNNEGSASGLYASTGSDSTGAGGNLTVQGGELFVRDEAEVTVSTRGSGAAGNLEVAANSIHLDNGSLTATTRAGNFGNINLRSQGLILRNGSSISTDATQGTANGGNITVDTGVLAGLEASSIIARAIEGRGGNILINTSGDFRSLDSKINADSQLGINGVVEIQTPDINPTQGIFNQPQLGVPPELAQGCRARGGQAAGAFINSGRGGIPPNPSEPLDSNLGWRDSRFSTSGAENYSRLTMPKQPQIVEAQGWKIDAVGNVELTAEPSLGTPYGFESTLTACNVQSD